MTGPAHGDPFALGNEYIYHQQPESSNDKWQQLHSDLRRDIAYRRHMRDAQVEGDDLHTEYQNDITFMTRQLLALEANFDQLRDAQAAVSRAGRHHNDCRDAEKAFTSRCSKWRNAVGGVGAVALILCGTLDDVAGFIILAAVLGPLAAVGLHVLGVLGGGGRAAKTDRADIEWQARLAELQHLQEQVMQGVRNPQPLPDHQPGSQPKAAPVQSTAVSLFPEQHAGSQSVSPGSDQSATTQPIAQ